MAGHLFVTLQDEKQGCIHAGHVHFCTLAPNIFSLKNGLSESYTLLNTVNEILPAFFCVIRTILRSAAEAIHITRQAVYCNVTFRFFCATTVAV
jgi:hypothetical protein